MFFFESSPDKYEDLSEDPRFLPNSWKLQRAESYVKSGEGNSLYTALLDILDFEEAQDIILIIIDFIVPKVFVWI